MLSAGFAQYLAIRQKIQDAGLDVAKFDPGIAPHIIDPLTADL